MGAMRGNEVGWSLDHHGIFSKVQKRGIPIFFELRHKDTVPMQKWQWLTSRTINSVAGCKYRCSQEFVLSYATDFESNRQDFIVIFVSMTISASVDSSLSCIHSLNIKHSMCAEQKVVALLLFPWSRSHYTSFSGSVHEPQLQGLSLMTGQCIRSAN